MADQSKASWPRTPDGTTDWEAVFEDPSIGFISLVDRTHSSEMAEKTAVVIIKKLFTRRNDLDLCQQNVHRIGKTVADHKDDLDRIHKDIAVLMREVKEERIELARVFIERKKAGAAIDRRAGLMWKAGGIFSAKVLLPVGILLIALIAGGAYYLLQPPPEPENTYADSFGQTGASEESKYSSTAFTDEPGTDAVVKPDPIPIWLKTVRWPLVPKKGGIPPKFYSAILYVANHDVKAAICGQVPSVMDRVIVGFNNAIPQHREPRIDELSDAQDEIKDLINKLMSADLIENVKIARYGTSGFKAASLPPFCKSPPRK